MASKKTLEELLAQAESTQIHELKQTNLKLLKQLEKAKDKKADLIDAVFDACKSGIMSLEIPNIPPPTPENKESSFIRIILVAGFLFRCFPI